MRAGIHHCPCGATVTRAGVRCRRCYLAGGRAS
jgi:hypothetical protein